MHGLQKLHYANNPRNALYDAANGFRAYFQAAAQKIDNVRASFFARKNLTLTKNSSTVGTTKINRESKLVKEGKVEVGTNLEQVFESNPNNEVVLTKPVVEVKTSSVEKHVEEFKAEQKVSGGKMSVSNKTEINLETQEVKNSSETSFSISGEVVQAKVFAKSSTKGKGMKTELGGEAKIKIPTSQNSSVEFGAKVSIKQ